MNRQWLEEHGFGRVRPVITEDVGLWRDPKWQWAHRITTFEKLNKFVNLSKKEIEGIEKTDFPMAITPYYLALMDPDDPDCPIRRQAIPVGLEARVLEGEKKDPLMEGVHEKVAGLVHRYRDRVLLSSASHCPVYCRYCTRRRYTGRHQRVDRDAWWDYLRQHKEVKEVIVSGGDPLSLSDRTLERILKNIRQIKHVEVIRISTRFAAVLPFRITDRLARMLAKYFPVFVLTQFNHPKECTMDAFEAIERLRKAGIPIVNQAVLLKGVNDDPEVIKGLGRCLLMMGIKPYYLHQLDAVEGISHFRVSLRRGLEIFRQIRPEFSGLGTPSYVIDLPDGGGKVLLTPEYMVEYSDRQAHFVGLDGRLHNYMTWEEE